MAPARLKSWMRRVLTVARHEWRLKTNAPLTYVFIGGFLVALTAAIFLVADLYATDEATARLLLVFLPWVALILVPALTMAAWSEEVGDRALELAQSLPLGLSAIVTGKFLASGAVLLVTLGCTFPFAATLFYLGSPDAGALLAAYLGAAMLLLAFLAVALLAASFAREPVSAFVLGVLALLGLVLLGIDVPAGLTPSPRLASLLEGVRAALPRGWLAGIGLGRVDFPSIVAFGGLTTGSLYATACIIDARRRGATTWRTITGRLAWACAGVAALAIVTAGARRAPLAIDLTAGREHTLSASTLDLVRRLPFGTEATLYWSRSDASIPAGIRAQAVRIEGMLGALAARSQGRLRFSAKDPAPDTDAELEAGSNGLRRVPLSAGGAFTFGAVVSHDKRVARIDYFDPRRDGLAEYDIARAMSGLARERTPKVGIVSPHVAPTQLEQGREGLSILAELKRAYDVAVIPHFAPGLPDGLDVLILIDATIVRRELLYAVDQHVMRGGGLIVLMDPRLQLAGGGERIEPQPSEEINDISDLLLRWGLRYVPGEVVGDESLAAPVMDSNRQQLLFPFWMRVAQAGLAPSHPVTSAINELLLVEAGSFEIKDATRASVLVSTTARSGVIPGSNFSGRSPGQVAGLLQPDGKSRVVAAQLHGVVASAFAGPPEGVATAAPHQARAKGRSAVFAVADADWLFDAFAVESTGGGVDGANRPLNDNWALLLNMVDYAGGDPALIQIRTRGRLARPFTKVAELLRDGQQRYRQQEAETAAIIDRVDQQIARIAKAAGVTRIEQLPDAIRDRIRQLYVDLAPHKKTLRDLRLKMREDVERLGRRITLLNLLSGPLLAGLMWVLVRHLRQWRLTSVKRSGAPR